MIFWLVLKTWDQFQSYDILKDFGFFFLKRIFFFPLMKIVFLHGETI